jgi:hypothetical protein
VPGGGVVTGFGRVDSRTVGLANIESLAALNILGSVN